MQTSRPSMAFLIAFAAIDRGLVVLESHRDGDDLDVPFNVLEKWKLNLDGMFEAV